MSIMYCDKHEKYYDSDFHEDCQECIDEYDGYSCICYDDEDESLEVIGYECMRCGHTMSSKLAGGELFTCGKCGGSTTEVYS